MDSSTSALRHTRKCKDILALKTRYNVIDTDKPTVYLVEFTGPQGTPFETGLWQVRLELADGYPFNCPTVQFINKIFHPNIAFENGSVCLNVLSAEWTPSYTLCHIFEIFLPQLLRYPNPSSALNGKAGSTYSNSKQAYEELVKSNIQKHAKQPTKSQVTPDVQPIQTVSWSTPSKPPQIESTPQINNLEKVQVETSDCSLSDIQELEDLRNF